MKKIASLLLIHLLLVACFAQNKESITVDDIWKKHLFQSRTVQGVNWTKDGRYYTSQNDRFIIKYEITSGKEVDTLYGKAGAPEAYLEFDTYTLSPQEDKILLASSREGIYRRSYKAYYSVYDLKTREVKNISPEGKASYATFSPNGQSVAFVRENNLYVTDLQRMQTHKLSQDGKINQIINGSTDWVYEEEFSFVKAFFWSPDSKKIAYYTFDEREVKEFVMQYWNGPSTAYPENYQFKYPKAGEKNSVISISVINLENGKNQKMDIGKETDIYIPRINWTQNPDLLSIRRMNRLQNQLEIIHADVNTGESKVILMEKEATYIDLDFTDDLTYLKDGKHFIHTSESSGYKHIYLYNMQGKLIKQITQGEWEVRELFGIDEKNKLIYFSSTEASPLERQVYRIKLNGKSKKQLSRLSGQHNPNFSGDFKYYLDYFSAADTPPIVTLHEGKSGKKLKTLEDNQTYKKAIDKFEISPKEFFEIEIENHSKLNAWMIKPTDFDERKKYPVLMYVYGGPGSQTVTNSWLAGYHRFLWHQVIASQGYIVVSVDNRGTGARGAGFKKITYANLGKYEIADQISAAKYLASLDYVDKDRIGIWGWSYGGYMSSLGISLGADVFKMAIAVAPVSSWRFYDSIYTERYLKRPQDNPNGYDDYSPINHVDKIKGKYLLIHGTGDDNVHFQNAIEMQNALISAGIQFDSFYYPNRNHRISGGNTSFHLYTMMLNFIKKNL